MNPFKLSTAQLHAPHQLTVSSLCHQCALLFILEPIAWQNYLLSHGYSVYSNRTKNFPSWFHHKVKLCNLRAPRKTSINVLLSRCDDNIVRMLVPSAQIGELRRFSRCV